MVKSCCWFSCWTGYVDASNSDVVVGFENVIGSSGNDTIKGK